MLDKEQYQSAAMQDEGVEKRNTNGRVYAMTQRDAKALNAVVLK